MNAAALLTVIAGSHPAICVVSDIAGKPGPSPIQSAHGPGLDRRVRWLPLGNYSAQHAHDVGLLHDQELLAIELDLGSRPLAEQHAVADLDVDRDQLSALVTAAGSNRGNFALRRLLLGAIGNDDAALGLLLGVDALDDDTVMQRTKFGFSHEVSFLPARFAGWFGIEGRLECGHDWRPFGRRQSGPHL